MVDELTQESFQTGKAIVTVSVDLIQAIAEACRKSEQNKTLNPEQKENVLKIMQISLWIYYLLKK